MSGSGAVKSDDLFPKQDIYDFGPKKEEKKLPHGAIAESLGMKDGDIAIIVMEKRETGGYVISTVLLSQPIKSRPLDLGNLLEVSCRKLVRIFLERKK
jgi:hypothetical protein